MSYYWKKASTLQVYFHVFESGAGKTGLSDGDFTKLVWKNGNNSASNAGITVSEVDASNYPGRYVAEVNGATGFVSANGQYELLLHWSSQTSLDGYQAAITVTNDGTGSGGWGSALFTASASDGRVVVSGTPLEGALIYVYTSSNALLYQTTTDSSGLWSVTLPADGSYTVVAQKTGYSTTQGTITALSGVATGPGADLSLTAIASSTGYTFSTLKAYALRQWFDKGDSQAEAMAGEIVNGALNHVATVRDWPYYSRTLTLDLNIPYNTGTITLTNGDATVTLSGGTWPSWVALGTLIIGGQLYDVASRTSDTEIELTATYPGTTESGASYTMAQYKYSLPSGGVYRIMDMHGGSNWLYGSDPIDYELFDRLRHEWQSGTGPYVWSLTKGYITVWPYYSGPSSIRMDLTTKVKPDLLTSDTDEADWDPALPEMLYRAIDLHITYRGRCRAGDTAQCKQNFEDELARGAGNDRSPQRYDINRRAHHSSWSVDLCSGTVS